MAPNLRIWPVLHHLTEDQIHSDIVYLVIYGDKGPNDYGTALYITRQGLVYASGVNSYSGRYSKQTEIIKDGGTFLHGSVEVEALSYLDLKKIVQGSGFGAGLTVTNDLYLWGNASASIMLGREYTVMYECYTPDAVCKKCATSDYSPSTIGGSTINKCETCAWYPSYSLQSPNTPETQVKMFIEFCDVVVVLCSKCRQGCSFLSVGEYDLFYCVPCDILQESNSWCEESSAPRKVQLEPSLEVVDMVCGDGFLLVQTASNNLVLWGYVGCRLQGYVNNPDDVIIQTVSCGGNHLAVITNKGALYTSGVGTLGQLGYEWNDTMGCTTLRKVTLPGTALKVCCGLSSTACLLVDGSVVFFGGRICDNGPPSIFRLKQHTFTDITCATLTDLYTAKTTSSQVFFWQSPTPKLYLKVDASDCIDALVGWPVTYNRASSEVVFMKQMTHCNLHGFSHYAELYGRKLLSDLTLKLKDGDFPAHRMVLYNNSVYYKTLFTESKDCEVVDVTSYDPGTYRNLLKYFYQALIEELGWRDLLDLHVLAISYNESEIVKDTFDKLQLMLNNLNIQCNLKDLVDECQRRSRHLELIKNGLEARQINNQNCSHQTSKSSELQS